MKKVAFHAVIIAVASLSIMTSCSGEVEGLAYNMTGVIQMAPKGGSGNDQYVAEILAFYQHHLDKNGVVSYTKIDSSSIGYDYYDVKIRSTQTTDGDAISAINKANQSKDEWIGKLPADNWHTSFLINCAMYSGSNSSKVSWEYVKNHLSGAWSGTTTDGKVVSFTFTDTRSDDNASSWTNPCTMTYDGSSWEGTVSYVSKVGLADKLPVDSVTADITFDDDLLSSASIMLNAVTNKTSCAITTLKVKSQTILETDSLENGIALKRD